MLRALLGAILALSIALQPGAAAPVTVRDAFDRSVTVPAPPLDVNASLVCGSNQVESTPSPTGTL